jgi:alpha-ketoglutarate-dependent taurine dioxygenase
MNDLKGRLTARRKAITPKPFSNLQEDFINIEYLDPGSELPVVIKPKLNGVKLSAWAASNRYLIETRLLRHAGILLRGFRVDSVDEFQSFAATISDRLLEYKERSSPRSHVKENVYTSTDYPADQSIFLHNENSYQRSWPMKILFFCDTPAREGGETPIADCRKILRRINPIIRDCFLNRQWMYVRNFGDGFGLPWQTVFQTSDKSVVEEHCRKSRITAEWKEGDRLRLRSVLPAMTRHPKTGEMIWFNHATFFHVTTLEKPLRESLMAEFKAEDLPTNTYYGDGSEIEDSVLEELRRAYEAEKVVFPWKQGDVLLLDNMLAAHGRNPYVGTRKVLVAMGEPFSNEPVSVQA